MPKRVTLWISVLCALATLTYRVDARSVERNEPRQSNGGYIAGTIVTDELNFPGGVRIAAEDTDGNVAATIEFSRTLDLYSNPYSLGPLAPGSYRVVATAITRYDNAQPAIFTHSYYDGVANEDDATVVEVSAAMTTTVGVDLTTLGEISGTVIAQQTHHAVEYATMVYAMNADGDVVAESRVEGGKYTFSYLGAGTYTISFSGFLAPHQPPCPPGGCEREQVYEPLTLPQTITIEPGEHVENVNATLNLLNEPPHLYTFLPAIYTPVYATAVAGLVGPAYRGCNYSNVGVSITNVTDVPLRNIVVKGEVIEEPYDGDPYIATTYTLTATNVIFPGQTVFNPGPLDDCIIFGGPTTARVISVEPIEHVAPLETTAKSVVQTCGNGSDRYNLVSAELRNAGTTTLTNIKVFVALYSKSDLSAVDVPQLAPGESVTIQRSITYYDDPVTECDPFTPSPLEVHGWGEIVPTP